MPIWWGATDDAGWHFRIPVTVHNDLGVPLTDHVTRAEIPLAVAMAREGWPAAGSAQRPILKAFRLDESSVRVVEYTNRLPAGSGAGNGRIVGEVPAIAYPGLLDAREPGPYANDTNPMVTVAWLMPGALKAGQARHFYVYFDSVLNGRKQAVATDAPAALENQHYVGAGTRLYGFASRLWVVGLHPDTTVTVNRYLGPTTVVRAEPPRGTDITNPFKAHLGSEVVYDLAVPAPVPVMVEADKPVLVTGGGRGFVPSFEGGLAGRTFRLPVPANTYVDANQGERPKLYAIYSTGAFSRFEMRGAASGLQEATYEAPVVWQGVQGGTTVTLTAGSPLVVQDMPPGGLIQVPSVTGTPTGTRLTGLAWTYALRPTASQGGSVDGPGPGGGASPQPADTPIPGRFVVAAVSGPAATRVSVVGPDAQVFPLPEGSARIETYETLQPGAPGAIGTGDSVQRMPSAYLDGTNGPPLLFTVDTDRTPDGRLMAWTGSIDNNEFTTGALVPDAGPVRVVSPYGGLHALTFEGVPRGTGWGDTVSVFAFYNNTVVDIVDPPRPGSMRLTLSRHEHREVGVSGPWSLRSSKPVAVLPYVVTGFFPAAIGPLPSEIGAVEFRGPLLRLAPAGDEPEPMLHTVGPGGETVFELNVTNLGRDIGGAGRADVARLSLSGFPTTWRGSLDRDTVPLGPGASAPLRVTVAPGPDAKLGDRISFKVVAESQANPLVRDEVRAIALVKTHVEFGLWYDRIDGPTSRNVVFEPGQRLEVPLVVKNLGNAVDRALLTLTGGNEAGWSASLIRQDAPVASVELGPGATAQLTLRMTAPRADVASFVPFEIEAASTTSSAAVAKVLGSAKIRTITDLRIQLVPDTVTAGPGQVARFEVTLDNHGNEAVNVVLNVSGPPHRGWAAPDLRLQGASLRDLSNLLPRQPVRVELAVPVPANATAFTLAPVTIRGEAVSPDGSSLGSGDALLASVVVAAVRDVRVVEDAAGYRLRSLGVAYALRFNLTNAGNAPEFVTVHPTEWPAGWEVQTPDAVDVAPNATGPVTMRLYPPPHVAPGNYSFITSIRSAGEERNQSQMQLVVPVFRDVVTAASEGRALLPIGGSAVLQVTIENAGNVRESLELAVDGGPIQASTAASVIELAPGDHILAPTRVDLPTQLPEGVHGIAFVFREAREGTGDGPQRFHQTLPIEAVAINLRLVAPPGQSQSAGSDRGDLFTVTAYVVNDGPASAQDVPVALLADGEVVDAVALEHVPPGEPRAAALAWRVTREVARLEVVVNPEGAFAEPTYDDNVLQLTPGERSFVPAASFPWVALAIVAVGLLVRRATGRRS